MGPPRRTTPSWYTGSKLQWDSLSLSAKRSQYRVENKGPITARNKAYRENQQEKIAAYLTDNSEKIAAVGKAYRTANTEKKAAKDKVYRANQQRKFRDMFDEIY